MDCYRSKWHKETQVYEGTYGYYGEASHQHRYPAGRRPHNRIGVRRHNEEVDKNRHVFRDNCVKFCGAFELAFELDFGLALRSHNETESSDNPGVASLDRQLLFSEAPQRLCKKNFWTACCQFLKIKTFWSKGIVRMLEDEDFCFILALFHKVKPHVGMLFLFHYCATGLCGTLHSGPGQPLFSIVLSFCLFC